MLSIRFVTSDSDADNLNSDTAIDYGPARRACAALIAWAADVARTRAPDDADAITRAEIAMRGQLIGRTGSASRLAHEDLLIAAAAVIDALAIDVGIPLAPQLAGALASVFANAGARSVRTATRSSAVSYSDLIGALLASLRTPGPAVVHLGGRPPNDNE